MPMSQVTLPLTKASKEFLTHCVSSITSFFLDGIIHELEDVNCQPRLDIL